MSYQLVWFKRDLRSHDHMALSEAARQGAVRCLYIVEPQLWLQPLINQLTFIPNKELWSQCRRPTVNYGSHRGIASLTRSMNCLRA